jgi:transcriptional regulator with XRE-family HTH domain
MARLRDQVRLEAERTSMRAVAREVGLTARALDQFLAGSQPRLSTQMKLRAWYVRSAGAVSYHDVSTARAALDVLTAGLPEPVRVKLRRALLDRIEEAHRKVGITVPKWVGELKGSG